MVVCLFLLVTTYSLYSNFFLSFLRIWNSLISTDQSLWAHGKPNTMLHTHPHQPMHLHPPLNMPPSSDMPTPITKLNCLLLLHPHYKQHNHHLDHIPITNTVTTTPTSTTEPVPVGCHAHTLHLTCLVFESLVRSGYLVPRGSNWDWDQLGFVPKPKIPNWTWPKPVSCSY